MAVGRPRGRKEKKERYGDRPSLAQEAAPPAQPAGEQVPEAQDDGAAAGCEQPAASRANTAAGTAAVRMNVVRM